MAVDSLPEAFRPFESGHEELMGAYKDGYDDAVRRTNAPGLLRVLRKMVRHAEAPWVADMDYLIAMLAEAKTELAKAEGRKVDA